MAMRLDVGALWVHGKTAALDEVRQQVDEGFATLRGLRAMGQGAIAILRRSGVVVALTAIAAALLCSAGWLGVIGAVFVIGIGVANAVGHPSHAYRRMAIVGAMVLAVATPCAGAIRVGANLAQQHGEAQFVSGWALFFGVTLVGTFMLLPLLEAAARTAQGSTVSAALAAALVATGRRGVLVTLLLACVATAAIAIIPVLDALTPLQLLDLRGDSDGFSESLAAFGAGAAVTLFVGMVMAATLASEQPAERVRSRSAFALVASAMLVLIAATLAGASLLPAPVRPFSGENTGPEEVSPGGVSAVVDDRLAGAPRLFVIQGDERTETIPLAPGDHLYGVFDMPDETVAVLVLHRDETIGVISVDRHGHRVDDGPLDRITAHLGWAATASLIACALMVIVAMSRTRRRARLHRAVRRHRETLLRGHLRGLELPPLQIARSVARTVGWSFESLDGTTWIALPPTMPILGAVRAQLVEGSTIELVSPDPIDRLQFRNGRTPAPPGTALVIPDAGPIEWLVGTWALAPAGSLLGGASLLAIAGMVLTLGGGVDVAPLVLEGADSMSARIESAAPEGDTRPLTDDARRARIESGAYRGITYVSGTETAISPEFREYLATLRELPDRARFEGVLLAGIQDLSLLDLLGFQEGDCILAVAGAPITTTDPILANLGRLLGAGPAVGIRVRRRGVELDLIFRSP